MAKEKAVLCGFASRIKERTGEFDYGGFRFTNRTKELFDQQEQMHMLDFLADVEEWTETLIRERSENILALAWDRISPWLGKP